MTGCEPEIVETGRASATVLAGIAFLLTILAAQIVYHTFRLGVAGIAADRLPWMAMTVFGFAVVMIVAALPSPAWLVEAACWLLVGSAAAAVFTGQARIIARLLRDR